jgi:DNA-binding transcriptional LysR family regulator
MELRQLAYFLAVAEERNFTRAAERVSIAQPAISQQIQRLETELKERLFVRDRRTVTLTAAGEALLPHARALLLGADRARDAVIALSGLLTGRLAVGLVQPLPDRRIIRLLGAFYREHPGVELSVVEGETSTLLEALRSGALDLALIGLGPYDDVPAGTQALLVDREPVMVALHPSSPLATRRSISLAALRDEPMVTLTRASKLRTTLETACQAVGFLPRVVAESSDLAAVVALAAEQVGVAVLPRSALDGASGVVRRRLTSPALERRLLLVSPTAGGSPAGRAFGTLARRQFRPL